MTGLATSGKLELNFSGATWTDVSSRLVVGEPVSIRRGRSNRYEDIQPSTLTCVLDNNDGALTPDNPLSTYYPNVTENIGVRFTVTKGSAYVRFYGRVTVLEPDSPDGVMFVSQVRITAVDCLGYLSRRTMRCDFVERWTATSAAGDAVDLFPFDDTTTSTPSTFRNATGTGTASLVRAQSGAGSVQLGAPDGVDLDSQVELTPTNLVGPVVKIVTGIAAGSVQDVVIPFRTADRVPAGGVDRWIAMGRDSAGAMLWSLRLVDNGGFTDLNLYDGSGTFVDTLYFHFAPAGDSNVGDDQWFYFRTNYGSPNSDYYLARCSDDSVLSGVGNTSAFDMRQTHTVVLGGALPYATPGKQTACAAVKFGPVAICDTPTGHGAYLQPNATTDEATRVTDVRFYTGTTATFVGGGSAACVRKNMTGRTAFDVAAEVARTTGALLDSDMTALDSWTYLSAPSLRSSTATLTLDAVTDLDATAGFPWRRGVDSKPSRVTVTSPTVTAVVEGDTSRGAVDDSIESASATYDQAFALASYRLNASSALAMTQAAVDLVSSATDLWASTMSLTLGDRMHVTSVPSTYFGRTTAEAYVLGWTEEYGQDSARFVFDTEPADAPAYGIFDDGTYGRFAATPGSMTVTGGTCVGSTSTGTIIVTTSGGEPTFTTSAGAYPSNLNWNGEIITVSAPAGSASPQTLTVTARGVSPTVARSHASGEAIDVAYSASFTFPA